MHSTSNNKEFTSYKDPNEVVNELFVPHNSRYQGNLEKSIRESDFIFNSVQLLYHKCHKINFRRDGSYIDSPHWISNIGPYMNRYK